MTNDERKYLLEETKRAQANGFEGSVLDVFRNPNILQEFQAQSVLQPTQGSNIQIASTPEEQQQGLRGVPANQMPDAMVFPNVKPNTSFNTVGMKAPIDINLYDDDKQGHLVKSYKNVPPGIANLPMGPQGGTVIETPAAQSGGIIQPKGDPWEYQYKDGKYLTRRRGSENWITARGNALEAIKTKVYKLPPTTQPPSRSAQQPRRQEERPERKVEIPAALDRTRVNSTQTSDNIELIPGLNLNTPAPRPRQQPARQEPTTSSDRVRGERLPRFDIGVRPNVAQADNTRTSPFPTPTRALNQPEIDELGRPLALRREAERRAQETPGEIRPASQNYRPKLGPSWLERTMNEASDAAAEWIDEKASGAKRVAGRILPADEESLIDVPEENIAIPTVENKSVPVQETFQELARYPDEIKGNELSSFVHTFDNIEGGTYRIGPKVKELYEGWNKRRGASTTMSGAAVAHFLRDSDVSKNQKFAPESWEIGRNNYEMRNMSKEGKLIGYTQKQMDDPERYRMMYRKNEDGTYSIKYKKLKDIGEEDAEWSYDLPVSRQHRFSDIDWDKKGKSTGYQALGGRTYFIPLKENAENIKSEAGLDHTSIPVGKGNEFSRFSGGSVIFLFTDPKTGREIGIDVSGSKDVLRDTGRKLIQQYGLKEEDVTVAYHDMGSYSAKPASKDGKLDYDQWINFNAYNRGFSGAPLIIANQQSGGIKKYRLGGVRKYQSAGLKLTPSDFEFTTDRTRGNARYFTDPKTGEPFPLVNLPEATVSAERTPYSQISNNSRLAGAYQAKPWFEAAGDNPDSPYFKMGQRIMNERIDDLNTAAFAYEFTGIPGMVRTTDRLQNNPADIFTLEGGLDALSLLGPVAIGSKATNVLKPASNARKFLPKQTFLTTTSSADDVGKGFKSEIDWRNWVKYAEDFDNNPDVVQNLLDIERKTKADGTWMKNSDGSPFQGTPEEFVIQQSDRFKKAYEQGYNEVYRGISRRENNAVNLDPDFTAATKRFPKGDRAIFGADYDLAKRYVKDIDPETGDFFTPDNPTILGSKDTGPGVYKLIYPKGKEVEFNAMGDFWGELNLNRSQTKSAINNTLAEKIEAFKRVEKYLGPKNALDLKKVIKNLEEAAQTAADSEKVLDPNLEKIRKTFPGLTTTDDLAKYIEGTDLSNIKLKNVDDGGVGDVDIINNAKGRYLKSKRGNILFDLNNPNVYKALVPAAVGAGTAAAAGSGPKEIIPPDFRYGGPISYQNGGLPGEFLYRSTSAGAPLAYDSPTANGYLLPDPNRPELMNTGATEYKMGVDNDLIPTVVNGMYFNPEDAYQRYRLTGEKFKPTADPSAYSKFYDEVNKLGIMKQKRSGGKKPKYKAPKMY